AALRISLSGATVPVSATASDNVGVVGVQFKLDGTTNVGTEDTTSPYAIVWDTTTVPDGSHTLSAVARDAAGNTGASAVVSVTVSTDPTPPTVTMSAPGAGAAVAGATVPGSATGSENGGGV